jgi:hypothetical protein
MPPPSMLRALWVPVTASARARRPDGNTAAIDAQGVTLPFPLARCQGTDGVLLPSMLRRNSAVPIVGAVPGDRWQYRCCRCPGAALCHLHRSTEYRALRRKNALGLRESAATNEGNGDLTRPRANDLKLALGTPEVVLSYPSSVSSKR